jgi:ribosomal protein L40E
MSIDEALMLKYRWAMKLCSKGHFNSPNAKVCWKCGEPLK